MKPFFYVIVHRDTCDSLDVDASDVLSVSHPERGFNTINTCSHPENFNATERLDFFLNGENLDVAANQVELRYRYTNWAIGNSATATFKQSYPCLVSAKVSGGKINPAGANKNSSALGIRSVLSVVLQDFPSQDVWQDPFYEDRISGAARLDGVGYDPDKKGTFFGKYLARNEYLYGRAITYVSGYIDGDTITDYKLQTFVITDWTLPDANGLVKITAKDPLILVADDKAKAPAVSGGKLLADLAVGVSGFYINADIINEPLIDGGYDGATYGYLIIDKEIMQFSRSSNYFTVSRAVKGTEQAEHKAGSTVQLCWYVQNEAPQDILYELLTTYTRIDPNFIDYAGWAATISANTFLQHTYSTLIAKPTEVGALLADIAEQMQFFVYFDAAKSRLQLSPTIPLLDVAGVSASFNDRENILEDTLEIDKANDETVTRLYIYTTPTNWAESLTDTKNYKIHNLFASFSEESVQRQKVGKSKQIFGYWLDQTLANSLGVNFGKLLAKPPIRFSFELFAPDAVPISTFIDITELAGNQLVDAYGRPITRVAQVTKADEVQAGTRWALEAISYEYADSIKTNPIIIIPDGTTSKTTTEIYAESAFSAYEPRSGDVVTFRIEGSSVVGGNIQEYGIKHDRWFANGVSCIIENNAGAVLAGKGGDGAGQYDWLETGQQGGNALVIYAPCQLDNQGIIGGGGGGGNRMGSSGTGAGGGGAGYNGGAGGEQRDIGAGDTAPNDGALMTGGEGGQNLDAGLNLLRIGGRGGDLGQRGWAGVQTSPPTPPPAATQTGALAGAAIIVHPSVTAYFSYINKGDVRGDAP